MTKKKAMTATAQSEAAETKPNGGSADQKTKGAQDQQLADYEKALKLFSERKYAEACDLFSRVATGPASNIADKARAYRQVCERKTVARQELEFDNAEDHFNYGVERLNARDIESARRHLGKALAMKPDAEHIIYTMALCCGISGDGDGACENLKRAIELEPKNRILARQDPEFAVLSQQIPALRALLGAD